MKMDKNQIFNQPSQRYFFWNRVSFFIGLFVLLTISTTTIAQDALEKSPEDIAIVMFGNSITYQGNWAEILGRDDVVNRGIPGYTSGQLIWTIKNVLADHPKAKIWFVEGGINDISLGVTVKRIFENQKVTLDSIKQNHIIPVMQLTILKNGDKVANRQVVKLNKMTRKYCIDHHIEFIDLNAFLSMDGELIKELTTDGCHLKPNAYLPWADAIKKVLEKYKIYDSVS